MAEQGMRRHIYKTLYLSGTDGDKGITGKSESLCKFNVIKWACTLCFPLCHFSFPEKCSECANTATKLQAVKDNRLHFLPFRTSSEAHQPSHSTGAISTKPRCSSFVQLPLTRSNLSKLLSHSITHFFVTVGTRGGGGSFFSGRAAKPETEHLSLSSTKFKNEWTYTPTYPFAIMACTDTPLPLLFIMNLNLNTIILGRHAPYPTTTAIHGNE